MLACEAGWEWKFHINFMHFQACLGLVAEGFWSMYN